MKILITGSNGFLGKELSFHLGQEFEVTSISRQDVDLSNLEELKVFFKDKYFDIVLHCAVKGGQRIFEYDSNIFHENIKMFLNISKFSNQYTYLINFGSGAELDTKNDLLKRHYVDQQIPEDYYGFSKNVIARLCQSRKNFYNFRIFNVFSENEMNTKMIKNNILRYINKDSIIIHQDKFMDFMYIEDLVLIIKKFINQKFDFNEIDCVYENKIKLSDIAEIINSLSDYKVEVDICNSELSKSYCGMYNNLKINYLGIENAIKKVYEKLK
jgi:nucleoside-diphosphate-sugar epimerase